MNLRFWRKFSSIHFECLLICSYYRSSTAPSSFKRFIPRLPFDTKRIQGGMLGKLIFDSFDSLIDEF
jgi:hypothetical protein